MTTPGSRADAPGPGAARPAQDSHDETAGLPDVPARVPVHPVPEPDPEQEPAGPAVPIGPPAGPALAPDREPTPPTARAAGPTGVLRRVVHVAAESFTRLAELALIGIGLFGLFGDWEIEDAELLLLFDLVAMGYLAIGLVVVRRQRRPVPVDQAVLRHRLRFDLLFSVTAALIGLYSALTVAASDPDPENAEVITVIGVLTVVLSWMLLHAGHARHYRNVYARLGGGLEWPVATPNPARPPSTRPVPRQLDFVYFAYAIGTSFGATDVLVTERGMRWSVLLHSCLAFFFNATVLAFLISRLSSL